MTGDEKKPPPFFCPSCGQKHRADISALIGVEGAVMKATCAGCGIALAVSLDEDDLPVCKALEAFAGADPSESDPEQEPEPEAPKAPVSSKAKGKAPTKSRKAKSSGSSRKRSGKDKEEAAAKEAKPEAKEKKIEAEFEKGAHVGRYQIEDVLGKGGTATVYSAFDPTTNRTVALKVIHPDPSDSMQENFLREIEVQANIRHPNIMPVFDRGWLDDGRPYFTMELLYKPWTLSKIVEHRERSTLSRYTSLKSLEDLPTLLEKVIVPVADGIYVANVENGVVHRDLKPDNVLIDSRTLRPYVIDFGICQSVESKSKLDTGPVVETTAETAGIVGTPRFLAPEQAKGSVNARTDVWGLGALIQFVLTGEPPIAGAVPITKAELKRRIKKLEDAKELAIKEESEKRIALCDEKLARLQDPGLRTLEAIFRDARDGKYGDLPSSAPAPLVALVKKAMAKTKNDRYVNARQLSSELSTWLKGGTVRALSQVGGKAAAVHTAKRALSAHLVTAIWILGALGVGLFLGKTMAGGPEIGASTRIADATQDVELLEKTIGELKLTASALTPVERNRIWTFMEARAARIGERLANEPPTTDLDAARRRLAYVRERIAPSLVVLDIPAGTAVRGKNAVTGDMVELRVGENRLPPGAYHVSLGDAEEIRFPIDVPFRIREVDEDPDEEPAIAVIQPPLSVDSVPAGMVLVLGGEVAPRGLPYAEPTSTLLVDAFLMDAREVNNAEYATFLMTLSDDEQKARTPSVAFVPDPQTGKPALVKGKEKLPVVGVRPEDAAAYAAWRAKREGHSVRLPREQEWVHAAGAGLGYVLANDAKGFRTEGDFTPPLRAVGENTKDVSPFGVRGLLANAREIVKSAFDDTYVVKGAGVGDDPDQGAVYMFRKVANGARHETTGFRCVRVIPASAGEPPR
ncbi:MAG: bifunctional serine/threonine-protein kinase/formylglycine-generating enzyme family protein [Planctomycetota bacterium]|nr:bifunctional serine/threonine-protein kinase/formylglycine-generating enzyme family protein [Planctomycetota bacterium]